MHSPTEASLAATEFLNFNHSAVQEFCEKVVTNTDSPTEIAVQLYYAVRDQFLYNPYHFELTTEGLSASTVIERGYGWCVPKAALLAACCRYYGIPARLGFADVRNHLTSEKLLEIMKSDIFCWHGYTSIWLDDQWVKATPAFNLSLCEKARIHPLEFNGKDDSLYQEYDQAGRKHMEYLRYRGEYDDLPLEEIKESLYELYPDLDDFTTQPAADSELAFENEVTR